MIAFDPAALAEIWATFAETVTIYRGSTTPFATVQMRFMKPQAANPTPSPAGYAVRQSPVVEVPIGTGLRRDDTIQRSNETSASWRVTASSIDEGVHTYERYEVESIHG